MCLWFHTTGLIPHSRKFTHFSFLSYPRFVLILFYHFLSLLIFVEKWQSGRWGWVSPSCCLFSWWSGGSSCDLWPLTFIKALYLNNLLSTFNSQDEAKLIWANSRKHGNGSHCKTKSVYANSQEMSTNCATRGVGVVAYFAGFTVGGLAKTTNKVSVYFSEINK